MATILFYEKPGCINNTRQKRWLRASGHRVIERNLLTEAWSASRLRKYFDGVPYAYWFNPSAPAIKSGALDPANLQPGEALQHMLRDPLLIRRPLMREGDTRMVGFDPHQVNAWVGLDAKDGQFDDIETCARNAMPTPLGAASSVSDPVSKPCR